MGFPDRIERTVELAAHTRSGGAAQMRWADEGFTARMRVERVEAPVVFGFTWEIFGLPEDDPRRTYVEFTLEPAGADRPQAARRFPR